MFSKPQRTYAAFYIFFFSFQALMVAFFPLYCKALGFSSWQIAVITSFENLANVLGPLVLLVLATNVWGSGAVLVGFSALTFLCFMFLGFVQTFSGVLLIWSICMVLTRSTGAIVNYAAIRDAVDMGMNYGRVRLWGSLAFIAVTCVVGLLYDEFGPAIFFPAGAVVLLCLALASATTVSAVNRVKEQRSGVLAIFRLLLQKDREARHFMFFLFSNALHWASHAALYTYFSIYLEALGWSGTQLSLAWTIAVLAEVVMLHYFDNVERRYTLRTIYLFSIGVTVLRWLILASSTDPIVIIVSQLLHAFTFGSFYVASMKIAHVIVPQMVRSQTQNLLVAFGGGIGLFLGRLGAGQAAAWIGDSSKLYLLFGIAAILAALSYYVARLVLPKEQLT